MSGGKTYIVEHLDPELGPWSELEYIAIAKETHEANGTFLLSSLPAEFKAPAPLEQVPAFKAENRGVEELYAADKSRVCLLDPSAASDLSPEDGDKFDAFLFGGILGDDPPRDRTSELRKKGFEGRRLGPKQMTTDTAVRVTRIVVEEKTPLDKVPYLDFPELKFTNYKSKLNKSIAAKPSVIEESVAQALFEVESSVAELKDSLKYVTVANVREIETTVKGKKKNVIVVYVPFPVLRVVQRITGKLVPELEKRLKTTVLIVGKRTIQSKWIKAHRSQMRPRNRALTAVYDAVLEDLVQPAGIVGKRYRHKLDGSVIQKVFLDQNEEAALKDKVESITGVYKRLTTRDIQIEFKPEWHFYTLKK